MPCPQPRRMLLAPPLAAALLMLLSIGLAAAALQFPPFTGRVVDQAQLLSPAEEQSLTEALAAHEQATGNQVVVATVSSLQDTPIADYGYQLGRAWGIGRAGKDNGVILIVAPNERKVRIEVGYGLEGALTDAASRIIIEQIMLPAFRSGQFGAGIVAGTGAILKVLAGEGEPQPLQERRVGDAEPEELAPPLLFLGIFVLFVLLSYFRGGGGGGMYGRRRGGGIVVPPIILGGGGFGGRGGGFGGGGFSGGGGSFGGGGASGDW